MIFSIYAKHAFQINLICLLLNWLFYNFKNFISNSLASPFKKKEKFFIIF